jgi:AcrR family transcriptional regulator
MTAPKSDRRTERTRQALVEAFVQLLLSNGYEAVTVDAVAERANVGRSTFYLHFADKAATLRRSLTRTSSQLAAIVGQDVHPEMLVPLLSHFHSQRKLNHVFFNWPVRPLWVDGLADLIEPRLLILSRRARARPILPIRAVALQLAETQIALIASWVTAKSDAKVEPVAEALIASMRALTPALLRVDPDTPLVIAENCASPSGASAAAAMPTPPASYASLLHRKQRRHRHDALVAVRRVAEISRDPERLLHRA